MRSSTLYQRCMIGIASGVTLSMDVSRKAGVTSPEFALKILAVGYHCSITFLPSDGGEEIFIVLNTKQSHCSSR